jgi:hypothetical protein
MRLVTGILAGSSGMIGDPQRELAIAPRAPSFLLEILSSTLDKNVVGILTNDLSIIKVANRALKRNPV